MDINKIISEEIKRFNMFSKYSPKNTLTENENIILEQEANVSGDVGLVMRELNKTNSDEQKIVDTLKKYKNNQEFQNFLNQYKNISGVDFGSAVYSAISQYNDKREYAEMKNHLSSLGFKLETLTDKRGRSVYTITSTAPKVDPQARQKHITGIYCSVKGGIINNPGSKWNGKQWTEYVSGVIPPVKPEEIETSKASCPQQKIGPVTSGGQKVVGSKSGGSNVSQRFSKSLSNVGIQGNTMDVATLQKISDLLEKGALSEPPIAQLNKLAGQLNQA